MFAQEQPEPYSLGAATAICTLGQKMECAMPARLIDGSLEGCGPSQPLNPLWALFSRKMPIIEPFKSTNANGPLGDRTLPSL